MHAQQKDARGDVCSIHTFPVYLRTSVFFIFKQARPNSAQTHSSHTTYTNVAFIPLFNLRESKSILQLHYSPLHCMQARTAIDPPETETETRGMRRAKNLTGNGTEALGNQSDEEGALYHRLPLLRVQSRRVSAGAHHARERQGVAPPVSPADKRFLSELWR